MSLIVFDGSLIVADTVYVSFGNHAGRTLKLFALGEGLIAAFVGTVPSAQQLLRRFRINGPEGAWYDSTEADDHTDVIIIDTKRNVQYWSAGPKTPMYIMPNHPFVLGYDDYRLVANATLRRQSSPSDAWDAMLAAYQYQEQCSNKVVAAPFTAIHTSQPDTMTLHVITDRDSFTADQVLTCIPLPPEMIALHEAIAGFTPTEEKCNEPVAPAELR